MNAGWAFTSLLTLGACGTTEPSPRPHCEDPQPILDPAGEPSGYERCADGSRIRVASMPVDLGWYADELQPCFDQDPGDDQECYAHGDCGVSPNARCLCHRSYWLNWNVCVEVCASDADCGEQEVCVAPEQGGSYLDVPTCRGVRCRGPEDCASGECGAAWATGDNSAYFATGCRSAYDRCRTSKHCERAGEFCWPTGPDLPQTDSPTWTCEELYFAQ